MICLTPGIVLLESPLLFYREPDSAEDYLSDTNLNGNFCRYLLGIDRDRQAIIVENMDPADRCRTRQSGHSFLRNS